MFFFFKQKTAYEMRISDWSSDVCSSDLNYTAYANGILLRRIKRCQRLEQIGVGWNRRRRSTDPVNLHYPFEVDRIHVVRSGRGRSEEHTSELQSLMRSSYAVFCWKKQKTTSTLLARRINFARSNILVLNT